MVPTIICPVILPSPMDLNIILIICSTKFYIISSMIFLKKILRLFSLFFPLLKCNSSFILLECTCLQVTMLTLSGLSNNEDFLSHMKRCLEWRWLQGFPIQTFGAHIKGSGLFHLHTWLSTGWSLSSPCGFRMAVAVPTAIPRRTKAQGRREYSSVCISFL